MPEHPAYCQLAHDVEHVPEAIVGVGTPPLWVCLEHFEDQLRLARRTIEEAWRQMTITDRDGG